MRLLPILLAVLGFNSLTFAAPVPCNTTGPECDGSVEVVPGYHLGYLRTHDPGVSNPAITNAIVIIHGIGRDFAAVYQQMNDLVQQGALSPSTLIIAPKFLAAADKPAKGWLYWDQENWPAGDNSLEGSQTSSFTALDQLVRAVLGSGNFPHLRSIMITGMSAGGQTSQRYAAGTNIDREFPDVHFRFMIAGPSSYMYLNADRWVPGTQYQFAKPASPGCDYNTYRYGLDHLNSYMSQKPLAKLVSDYLSRDIDYIVGELDDATQWIPVPPVPYDWKDAMDLDVSCPSEWEGNSRFQRSFMYSQYLNAEFPQNKHVWLGVPGVAHENRVYADPRVVKLLGFTE